MVSRERQEQWMQDYLWPLIDFDLRKLARNYRRNRNVASVRKLYESESFGFAVESVAGMASEAKSLRERVNELEQEKRIRGYVDNLRKAFGESREEMPLSRVGEGERDYSKMPFMIREETK